MMSGCFQLCINTGLTAANMVFKLSLCPGIISLDNRFRTASLFTKYYMNLLGEFHKENRENASLPYKTFIR